MASPKKIEIAYSFLDHTVNEPDVPQPGDKLDEAFSEVKRASDETIDRLNLIQRDDGQLARVVGTDQFTEPFLDQFAALKTGAETAATSAAQSAASALADKNDAAQILTDTRAVRDEVNQTASTFDATFSQALTDLDAAKTSAVGAVNTSKTEGVAAVEGAKTGALTDIGTAKDTSLAAINSAKTAGVNAVNGAQDNAVETIGLIKSDAVSYVESTASNGRTQISADTNAALNQINLARIDATTEIAGQVVIATNAATSASSDAEAIELSLQKMHGGTTGQVLTKLSNADNDFKWENMGGGGDMLETVWKPIIEANTDARHSHANKTVLDNTTAAFTTEQSVKLGGIAEGATANTGTVTSVGVAVPAGLSATGAITTSGTITLSYASGYQGYTTAEANKLAGINLSLYQTTALKGLANGYAGLDATGKVPTVQLPDAVLGAVRYIGVWDASTNTPAIPAASTGNKGWYYMVSVTGTTNIDGNGEWVVGDWIVSNGTRWDRVKNVDAVISVADLRGAITAAALRIALSINNVANKTEAQMAATGAIADALGGKLDTDAKAADSALLNGQTAAQLPVSTAQQAAINSKQNNLGYTPANKDGDTFTGDCNFRYIDIRRGAAFTQQAIQGIGWSSGFVPWRVILNGDKSLAWWAYNENTGDAYGQRMLLTQAGNFAINGSLSKGSGTFLIDHPLDPENKNLRHAFVEAPENLNIYRGIVRLVNGKATVDIDSYFGMTTGTFWALNTDIIVSSLQNQEGGAAVWPDGKMTDGTLKITCSDEACNDEIAWMVTGRRKDPYVLHLDPNCERGTGRFIPEFDKED